MTTDPLTDYAAHSYSRGRWSDAALSLPRCGDGQDFGEALSAAGWCSHGDVPVGMTFRLHLFSRENAWLIACCVHGGFELLTFESFPALLDFLNSYAPAFAMLARLHDGADGPDDFQKAMFKLGASPPEPKGSAT